MQTNPLCGFHFYLDIYVSYENCGAVIRYQRWEEEKSNFRFTFLTKCQKNEKKELKMF